MSKFKSLDKRLKAAEKVLRRKTETIWDAFERAPDDLETTQDCYFYLIDQGFTLEDINGAINTHADEEAEYKDQTPI